MEASAINSRIDLRTSDEAKQIIKTAATLSGMSMTDFIMGVTLEKARECLQNNTSQTLSLDDYNAMMNALDQPSEPTQALRQAAAKHPHQGASFDL